MSMYQIHLYRDPKDPALRAALLQEAALTYASGLTLPDRTTANLTPADLSVSRSASGKPFFTSPATSGINFSISHSGELWVCVLGPAPCGLDIQKMRPCRQEAIARRYFSAAEQAYVKQEGLTGFYEIWIRREALAKYSGAGFFGMAEERPVLAETAEGRGDSSGQERSGDSKELKLRDHVIWRDRSVWFHEICPDALAAGRRADFFDGTFAAVWCSEERKGDVEIVNREENRRSGKP